MPEYNLNPISPKDDNNLNPAVEPTTESVDVPNSNEDASSLNTFESSDFTAPQADSDQAVDGNTSLDNVESPAQDSISSANSVGGGAESYDSGRFTSASVGAVDDQNVTQAAPVAGASSDLATGPGGSFGGAATSPAAPGSDSPDVTPQGPLTPVGSQPSFGAGQQPAPPKSKKGLVIGGIVAGVAALLIGGASAVYGLWYQHPDKVIGDAIANIISAKSAKINGTMDFSKLAAVSGTPIPDKVSVKFDSQVSNSQASANIDISTKYQGKDINLGFGVSGTMTDEDYTYFYKVSKLQELLTALGATDEMISPSITALIRKVDNKWIKLTKADVEKMTNMSEKDKEVQRCAQKTFNKLSTDRKMSDELANLYANNPLLVVKEKLGSKDGSLGYLVAGSKDNAKKLVDGIKTTQVYAELKKCDSSIKDDSFNSEDLFSDDKTTDKNDNSGRLEIWIDRWSHQLTRIEGTVEQKDSANPGALKTVINTDIKAPISVTEPTDSITFDELNRDVEKIIKEMTTPTTINSPSQFAVPSTRRM